MTARRRQLGIVLALASLIAGACSGARSSDDAPDGSIASRPPSSASGDAPANRESDCQMDTVPRHEDPVALVEEFVRRDAEGPFEREDIARAWEAGAFACLERSSSDHYEVITAFRVEPLDRRVDTARVVVRRTRAFTVTWDSAGRAPELTPSPASWVDTAVVIRTRFGWRIDRIHAGAHRLPSRALGELSPLSAADSARLRRIVSPSGG